MDLIKNLIKIHFKLFVFAVALIIIMSVVFIYLRPHTALSSFTQSTGIDISQRQIVFDYSNNLQSNEQHLLFTMPQSEVDELLGRKNIFKDCSATNYCPPEWTAASDTPQHSLGTNKYDPKLQHFFDETKNNPSKCTFIIYDGADGQALKSSTYNRTVCLNPETGHARYTHMKL